MSNDLPQGISSEMAKFPHRISGIVPDRGPAEYFHGRSQILFDFEDLLKRTVKGDSGTTFLIQGAPGAGKSALLYECQQRAKAHGWEVTNIEVGALWDPNILLASLGHGEKYKGTERSTQVGFKSFLGWGFKSTRPQPTVRHILEDGSQPLLLILDEAQSLGDDQVPPDDHRSTAIGALEAIHNGKLERPVVLLAAGLGTTKASFGSLKVSRFKAGCFVELGALGKKSERAVIRDWLKKRGTAKGDSTAWIDAIAQETHGWPHHILSYVYPASEHLKANGGIMTPEGLHVVLEAGREGRKAYYRERAHGFPEEERQGLAKAFADISLGESMTRKAILSSLAQDFEPDEAKDLFNRAWDKGLLDERSGRYLIPIPSMQDWLISNYGRERIAFSHAPPKSPAMRDRNLGLER